jgi:C4-dicarboxylate-specific signal transduction histidine kinase
LIYIRHLGVAPEDTKKDFAAALIRTHALTLATEALHEAQVDLAHVDRITTIGLLTASIVPEVTQPIAAIVTNAQAARHFLDRRPPDLDEVREALDRIVTEAYRASDVIYRIRGLLKKTPPKRERAEINGAIRDVLELTRAEEKRRISPDAVCRAIAGCPGRPDATAASNPQFDYQRRRGNEQHARRSTRIADLY